MTRVSNDIDSYNITAQVGSGEYSNVYKAERNYETYAIKVIDIDLYKFPIETFEQETSILQHLEGDDRYIQYVTHWIDTDEDENLTGYIVTEYFDGKHITDIEFLYSYLIPLFTSLIDAIINLHDLGIEHNDIRGDNILYANGIYRIIDFGLASINGAKNTFQKHREHEFGEFDKSNLADLMETIHRKTFNTYYSGSDEDVKIDSIINNAINSLRDDESTLDDVKEYLEQNVS